MPVNGARRPRSRLSLATEPRSPLAQQARLPPLAHLYVGNAM